MSRVDLDKIKIPSIVNTQNYRNEMLQRYFENEPQLDRLQESMNFGLSELQFFDEKISKIDDYLEKIQQAGNITLEEMSNLTKEDLKQIDMRLVILGVEKESIEKGKADIEDLYNENKSQYRELTERVFGNFEEVPTKEEFGLSKETRTPAQVAEYIIRLKEIGDEMGETLPSIITQENEVHKQYIEGRGKHYTSSTSIEADGLKGNVESLQVLVDIIVHHAEHGSIVDDKYLQEKLDACYDSITSEKDISIMAKSLDVLKEIVGEYAQNIDKIHTEENKIDDRMVAINEEVSNSLKGVMKDLDKAKGNLVEIQEELNNKNELGVERKTAPATTVKVEGREL